MARVLARTPKSFALTKDDEGVARWVQENGRPAGIGTDTLPAVPTLSIPLRGSGATLGVATLALNDGKPLAGEAEALLDGLTRLGAMALARAELQDESRASLLRAKSEEMRSALLSGVSHDLRTPLAAITGAATTLRDDAAALTEGQRIDLIESICEDSARLDRLATNLLDRSLGPRSNVSRRRHAAAKSS